MPDMIIYPAHGHIPVAVCQAQARDAGLILQTDGRHTIAAPRVLKGYQPVRTGYRNRHDFTPEAA
jgi:hypothetical protein